MLKRDCQASDDGRQIQSLAPVKLWSWNSDGHDLKGERRERLGSDERQNCRNKENVNQSDLEEEEPAETHKLVVAKSGEGPSHPHKKENDDGDLCEEDCDIDQAKNPSVRPIWNSRQIPAAKK